MTVELKNLQVAISNEEMDGFEAEFGAELPPEYRRFLAVANGAEPEPNVFRIGEDNESGVNQFIPFGVLLKERTLVADAISPWTLPIAWAEGGNLVCLDLQRSGEVMFWDHESPSKPVRLARSLDDFLELLEPFDVDSVELEPGQVLSAWIDPSLREK